MNLIINKKHSENENITIRTMLQIFRARRRKAKINELITRDKKFLSKGEKSKIKKHFSVINSRSYKHHRFLLHQVEKKFITHR